MSQKQQIKFVKKLQRESKSPFNDSSTSLWLANIVSKPDEELELNYSRYIYAHRDDCGRIVGISISKSMVAEHPNINTQYLTGDLMYGILIFYINEIQSFCELWADEFEMFHLLPPDDYFEAASWRWNAIVVKSDL